jgi:hypothetical protein
MKIVVDIWKEYIEIGDCIVFMNDILGASDTKEEYGYHVYAVIDT